MSGCVDETRIAEMMGAYPIVQAFADWTAGPAQIEVRSKKIRLLSL
ncbi:MAG: hypothetical protein R3F54_03875 [Alphaproteobacteria bacterium]